MDAEKIITSGNLDQGIKAAYKLGLMDGEASIRVQLAETRQLLKNMLTTHTELHRLLMEEKREQTGVFFSAAVVRGILGVLKAAKSDRFNRLKKKYENQTGLKYIKL